MLTPRSRFQKLRSALWLGTTALTLGFSSCAHVDQEMVADPFMSQENAIVAAETPEPKTQPGTARSIEGIPLPVSSPAKTAVANPNAVRKVAELPISRAQNPEIKTVDATMPAPLEMPGETAICPPCQTVPSGSCPPPGFAATPFPYGAPICPPVVPAWIGGAAIAPIPKHYPDEYLCDGGDRGYPVRYDFNTRLGLETEDTVVEYSDHTGKSHVKPTNKVCVYAPRFGAMRVINGPELDTAVNQLASADKFAASSGVRNRFAPELHNQNTMFGAFRTRERASDVDTHAHTSAVAGGQRLAGHTLLINTFEDFQFVHSGLLTQTDEARLAKGLQSAAVWTRTQFPVIVAQSDQAQEVISEFNAQEFVANEDKRKPGRLRIAKLADKTAAQPGDVITFTIRFDNLGERELTNIRIIDNLTPRLQYIEDSETSDRAGQLVLQDNEEGSLILEFRLDEPLPAGEGGVVTFQTKVR